MVVDLNMDIQTRLSNMYKSLGEPKLAEDRKEISPDEFWKSMNMVSYTNQGHIKYQAQNCNY